MNLRTLFAAALLFTGGLAPALAQDFPVTLTHMYGATTIEKAPERVVSLGYAGADNILALGIKPVAVRYWYGDYPYAAWPWAVAALGDSQPVVLTGDLNIEQIAALQPDLILAVGSGITKEQYALLSQIAPTVAPEAEYGDYGTPWQVDVRTDGKALGKSAEAEVRIKAIEDRFAAIRAAHPGWQDKTAAVGFFWNDAPGAYRSIDMRPRLLASLGLGTPEAIDKVGAATDFYASFSAEDLSPLDADVLVWFDDAAKIKAMKLRPTLRAYSEGREIFADALLSGAFSYSSLLSIDYVLDQLVPLIELAIDGDPATIVPDAGAGQNG
ncbi:MAG: iron-siderophore ABC transporter substrate-binding protein [Devosia nanyangense]|uniref:Iron-siderophore ABC transporter substrate-binding protein n=1 Tax=Devosia nanyangense TaxID=1228055 RepID=A0A933L4T9_9HYPH|nr:iron-siderophore ABC transporter substrate-binding protein [Devosia nanyangense]